MEMMQLEMFVAVVEECSIRRAAERVYRSQPAVSIALGKLQDEVGRLLMADRRRTNRRLTQAGETLYEYASRIVTLRNEALSLLQGENRRYRGRVFVGTDDGTNYQAVQQLATHFGRQYPEVIVLARKEKQERLVFGLRRRRLDCAVFSKDPENRYDSKELLVTPMCDIGSGRLLWLLQPKGHQSEVVKLFVTTIVSSHLVTPLTKRKALVRAVSKWPEPLFLMEQAICPVSKRGGVVFESNGKREPCTTSPSTRQSSEQNCSGLFPDSSPR